MANILDYLTWRGDIRMTERQFNEVDNLILSELAYLKMDHIVPAGFDRPMTLRTLPEAYQKAGYDQSGLVNDPLPMLKAAAQAPRFQEIRVCGYVNRVDETKQEQFSAVTFLLEDDSIYIAFRGTDNTIVGWREDFNISFLHETPGQMEAAAYIEQAAAAIRRPIRVGGHSKGGNFAVYGAAFCDELVKSRIIQVFSNDGPGFNQAIADSPQYLSILDKVEKIIPESSLIGVLLSSRAENRVVRSTARGIQQHNPYTWCVLGTDFETADQRSVSSLYMDETLKKWVGTLSEKQLSNFVTAVFDALEASGASTFTEVNANRWISYNAIAKAVAKMDKELQSDAMAALFQLARTGRDVLWNEAKKTFERIDQKTSLS